MRFLFWFTSLFFISLSFAQQNKIISGPWAGNVQLRSAVIWVEVSPLVRSVGVNYFPSTNGKKTQTVYYKKALGKQFNPVKIELDGLDPNTNYYYTVLIDGKEFSPLFPTKFSTQDLWQWRKPAPDFSFLAGSCSYFNDPLYDRPGKPYGSDSSIFKIMAETPAAFHVWMGDNWYTREADYGSAWGLNYRASHDRAQKVLQEFMAAMPQYAIWDDHDYGPDDEGKSYILKNESREIFKKYSLNPSYGEDNKGIYTKLSYSDADLFLTDDRFFRSEDGMPDSVNGTPSREKHFFGPAQMEWLKNSLQYSKATFKIIVVGSQVLNPLSKAESMQQYPFEYSDLTGFIHAQNIEGVVFFTGDRHHSEVIRSEKAGSYPLYDVTISPYTAGVSRVEGEEKNNPYRVAGTLTEAQNFGKISVTGPKGNRVMEIVFIGIKGQKLGGIRINENELKALVVKK